MPSLIDCSVRRRRSEQTIGQARIVGDHSMLRPAANPFRQPEAIDDPLTSTVLRKVSTLKGCFFLAMTSSHFPFRSGVTM